jgi:Cu/Ag efflux protein CusF
MNNRFTRCAYATGAVLALTIGANAMSATAMDRSTMNLTGPGNPPAAKPGNGPLWMAQAQQSGPRKIFEGVGVVTAIEPAGTLTINHQPIEGLMPAMEMTFSVNPRALARGVHPGDQVEFSVDGKTFTIVALKVHGHTN